VLNGDEVARVVEEVLRPLIEADGGRIELASLGEATVVLTLRGTCVGCPGLHYTRHHVLEPALRTAVGNVHVEVRTVAGPVPPDGA
jgi:NifU-like protein